MKPDLSVRGMRDYYPEIYSRVERIFNVWKNTALSYGFEQFDGPVIETLELYKIKSGEEIVNQLYSFTDKGGRELALRPELTPTLARMVIKIQSRLPKPIKWFSIPRCMRYEKPQKGRLREFYQLNVDILGEEEGLADVEVISVAVDSLINLGLTSQDFVVKVNSRDFVSQYFKESGLDGNIKGTLYKIIDNARKIDPSVTRDAINDLSLTEAQRRAVFKYLSLKTTDDLKGLNPQTDGQRRLVNIFELIDEAGILPYCEFDPTIVRGLDYYTGIVFEIYDRSESMRAICGGGRYNNLLMDLGGQNLPACGFGMGDVVLGEILLEKGLFPEYQKKVDYFLIRITDQELGLMMKIARALRKKGNSVEYTYRLIPVKKQMARASKSGARWALILGIEEIKKGMVVLKDLVKGEEINITVQSLMT